MVKQLRHVGLVVADIDKAMSFYGDALGFKVVADVHEQGSFIAAILGVPEVRVRTVKMCADDGGLLELLCFDPLADSPGRRALVQQGFSHVALTVDDIDAMYGKLRRAGVGFISTPQVSANGKVKVVFGRDGEGNFFELVQELAQN